MGEDFVMTLGNEALVMSFMLGGPILFVAMAVGIGVSLLQAITQINEATLTFVPKIIAISLVLVVAGPWMVETITNYTTDIITRFPEFIR